MVRTRSFEIWTTLSAAIVFAGVAIAEPPDDDASSELSEAYQHDDEDHADDDHGSDSRFPDKPQPLRLHDFPDRPKPLIELGDPLLGTGPIGEGIELPTGAVWQPSFVVFGTARSAIQVFDNGPETFSEWANRIDLFGNLQLSGTERILVGIRPLDQDNRFTGYFFEPSGDRQHEEEEEFNARITTLFFEGDLGEIFPNLDPTDSGELDIGFSVGRQLLFYQEGMLINDTIDSVGITKNNILPAGASNMQVTFVYGWNDIHRDNNIEDNSALLFGLFTELDTPKSTLNFDLVYVHDEDEEESGFVGGVSAVQRIGYVNTSFRALGSIATDEESDRLRDGALLFGEVSWVPHHTHDNMYVNAFWGIDNFSSAARAPDAGGPLGRTGILFAAVGLGRYGAALGNRADDSVGAAVGYQHFWDETRQQFIVEAGGRGSTKESDSAIAIAGRYQRAVGQHTVLRVDTFARGRRNEPPGWGARFEIQFKF